MRTSRVILIIAVLSATLAQAQSGTLRGIEVADINRSVDACSDFFEFGNGKWRAENPIPAAMPRWSRRWAAGEAAKDRLHEILDQVSAIPAQPKGSVEQLIGDFYGACTDQATINSLGAKPILPLLAEIDQIRDVAAVQRMIARFHAMNNRYRIGSRPDDHVHQPAAIATLQERLVHRSLLRLADRAMTAVANDADDLGGIRLAFGSGQQDVAADRIDAGKVSRRELLINHDHRRRA